MTGLTGTPGAYVRDPSITARRAGNCTSFVGLTKTDFTQDSGGVALSALNVIPTSRQDPNAVKLLGLYPAPDRLPGDWPTISRATFPARPKNSNT